MTPARPASGPSRRVPGQPDATADVAILAAEPEGLSLLLVPARTTASARGGRWELPWTPLRPKAPLVAQARRTAAEALGVAPAWLEQVGAFDKGRHPSDSALSIAFLGLAPERREGTAAGRQARWFPAEALPPLAPRQREMVGGALALLRERLDVTPVAFHLLPEVFTLSQLQEVYELVLGHSLHKASFRRALQAASLVRPLAQWRTEGRGRPAQLYRYAPRKRRGIRRGVRFDIT